MFFHIKYYIRYHVHYDPIFLLKTSVCLNWEIDHKGFTPKCWQLSWESEIIGKFSFFFPVWPHALTVKLPGRFFSSLGNHIFRQEPLPHSLAQNNTSNEWLWHYCPIKAPRCPLPTLTASLSALHANTHLQKSLLQYLLQMLRFPHCIPRWLVRS